jgi:hypothetical protein
VEGEAARRKIRSIDEGISRAVDSQKGTTERGGEMKWPTVAGGDQVGALQDGDQLFDAGPAGKGDNGGTSSFDYRIGNLRIARCTDQDDVRSRAPIHLVGKAAPAAARPAFGRSIFRTGMNGNDHVAGTHSGCR